MSQSGVAARKGTGWVGFAGFMLILAGIFNFIDGIVAIRNANYLAPHLVFGSLNAWGWTVLIIGIIVFLTGLFVLTGSLIASFIGILVALLSAIGQLLFLGTYPVWSIIMIAMDVLVIYALVVYGGRPVTE